MPNIKSAKKRMKTSEKSRTRNRVVKRTIVTARKNLYDAIAGGDRAKCEDILRRYCSILDKAVKKGMVKANTANRRKSRAVARLRRGLSAVS